MRKALLGNTLVPRLKQPPLKNTNFVQRRLESRLQRILQRFSVYINANNRLSPTKRTPIPHCNFILITMSLVEASNSHLPFPLLRLKPSDETLIPHLRSSSISLARISGAIDLLALDSHLDASLPLLDSCNAASAAIELLRRRLFPLRLLSSSPASASASAGCACDAIAEWAALAAPRGGISAVGGVIAAGRSLAATEEMATVEVAVGELTATVVDDGPETERLRGTVLEVGKATEELTAGLDRLGRAVDAVFHAVMGSRNAALQRIRFGPLKCYK